jgi:hypothetical protein
MKKDRFEITSKDQKVIFEKKGKSFGLSLYVKSQKAWQLVTKRGSPLIKGPSFNLCPQTIKSASKNRLLLSGRSQAKDLSGKSFSYPWQAELTLQDNDWFRLEIETESEKPIALQHLQSEEPQIGFCLPSVSVQEEGGFIWNQVLVSNPATDSQGVQGSDLPAVYFFDPATKAETMIYLDWESLTWPSNKNIFGFLGGTCGLRSTLTRGQDQPVRERFLGFYPENRDYLGNIFPKGKQLFRFYFTSSPVNHQPDEWEALVKLTAAITPLLKSGQASQMKDFSWSGFAEKCLQELSSNPKNQVKFKDGGLGLRAYAQIGNFRSPNPSGRVELMTQVDLIWPLLFYEQLKSSPRLEVFLKKLFRLLPKFFDHQKDFLGNWYPHDPVLKSQDQESWYFLENGLIKFGWIALLTEDKKLKEIFLRFAQKTIEIAHQSAYLLPLRYDWRKGKSVGGRKNFIAGGLFAYGMYLAFALSGKDSYLKEAELALRAIHQLPLDWLFHEPQQLGFAAAAALALFKETEEIFWKNWAWEFFAQELRMFYWYTDPSLEKEIGCDCAGMVRSFPSKIYPVVKHNPAFKENVESVLPWIALLEDEAFTKPLLKFLNLVRINNFYFFDIFQGIKKASFVPLEALPALSESGSRHRGGGVGHAIYGAGEVFWLSLLFEAQAEATDREIMVVCLDFLKPKPISSFGRKQSFIIYNPTKAKREFELLIKNPPKRATHLTLGSKKLKFKPKKSPSVIKLALESQEYQYVKIS